MPATPVTIASRASAARLAQIVELHGGANYKTELIREHSATLAQLSAECTAAGAPPNIINAANIGMQACGDAGELYGSMGNVWRAKEIAVPAIIAACDYLEALP